MSLRLSDYDFDLPRELVASYPLADRAASRMLVVHRESGQFQHCHFSDLPHFLTPDDLLVLNNSKVIPARLLTPDARIEVFLFKHLEQCLWQAFTRPGKRTRPGDAFEIAGTRAYVESICEDDGTRFIRFESEPDLDQFGHIPIPPYLGREDDENDRIRYQTVFASSPGSVAAPTAGLHFTPQMLDAIPHAFVTLHVGPGTFLPVKSDRLDDHRMHREEFEISSAAADSINSARRVVAVGTTSLRVLESLPPGNLRAQCGDTDIFIRPGFSFQHTNALLTNFHLPKSTLFVLVCAMAGLDLMQSAYAVAIQKKYRFFSYGDCMLIL